MFYLQCKPYLPANQTLDIFLFHFHIQKLQPDPWISNLDSYLEMILLRIDWTPERICNANGTESKRAGKKERKEARKKILNGQPEKVQFFWLMRMHQIEIIQIFASNLREIYLFGTK